MNPIVWNFAGSDSFGAAGAQADLKTITAHGCHTNQIITALTAQSATQCLDVFSSSKQQISAQINASKETSPAAIKIGMIANAEVFAAVSDGLDQLPSVNTPVVLDPVLASSSGMSLVGDLDPIELLSLGKRHPLFITPNIEEASVLTGLPIKNLSDLPQAADALLEKGAYGVFIKGGHLEDTVSRQNAIDYYTDRTGLACFLSSPRLERQVRGTGCTLASAFAANLALGFEPADAIVLAKAYLNQCIHGATPFNEHIFYIEQKAPALKTEFMPTATTGRHFSGEIFDDSPKDSTGFYVIADDTDWIEQLSQWQIPTLQLRIKDPGSFEFASVASIVKRTAKTNSHLYINDYWQEAIQAGAYGIHLGQEDLLTADVHAIKKAGLRFGISTHSWFEAAVAHRYKPSYIALGPIFPTTCKSMRFGPQGFDKLSIWKKAWPYPVVAIGGLTIEHADTLRKIGVDGVAVISDIVKSDHPEAQAIKWLKAFPNNTRQDYSV